MGQGRFRSAGPRRHARSSLDSGTRNYHQSTNDRLPLTCSLVLSVQTRIEALAGRFCIAIACGGEHTLAITRTGELFAWGSNGCGQLGLADSSSRRCVAWLSLSLSFACSIDWSTTLTAACTRATLQ